MTHTSQNIPRWPFVVVVVVVVFVVAVFVVIFVVVVVIVVLVFKGGCDEANYWLSRSVYWLHLQLLPPKLRCDLHNWSSQE